MEAARRLPPRRSHQKSLNLWLGSIRGPMLSSNVRFMTELQCQELADVPRDDCAARYLTGYLGNDSTWHYELLWRL
jgi:hypothetical protein